MIPADPVVHEDRHGRILAELAGMGLELARDLRERALAAETTEEAVKLARAFQSVSRGLRQTLALELKVARFRQQLDLELEAARAAQAQVRAKATRAETDAAEMAIHSRRNAVASEVERLIYSEDEPEEGEDFDEEAFEEKATRLQRRLNAWLETAVQEPDFTTAHIDHLIIEACEAVGLDPGLLYDFGDEDGGEADEAAEPPPIDEGVHKDADALVPADTG